MNGTGNKTSVSVGELLPQALAAFVANAALLVGSVLVIFVCVLVVTFILGIIRLPYVLGSIGGIVVSGPLALGFVALVMAILKKQPANFGLLLSGLQRPVPAILAILLINSPNILGSLFGLIPGWFVHVLCALIFFIPGLVVSMIYSLTFFYMNEKRLDFWPAMEASRMAVMGNLGPWIMLWLVLIGINIVGAIPCGLGLLVTGPLSALTLGLAYQRVEGVVVEAPPPV